MINFPNHGIPSMPPSSRIRLRHASLPKNYIIYSTHECSPTSMNMLPNQAIYKLGYDQLYNGQMKQKDCGTMV